MSDGQAVKPAPIFTPAPVKNGPVSVGTPPQAVMPAKQDKPKPVKKDMPATSNKVIGAKVIVRYRGEDGQIHEAATTVDETEFKVQRYSLDIDEKHEKKRDPETKDLLGYEDTGERVLIFKLRYHVR